MAWYPLPFNATDALTLYHGVGLARIVSGQPALRGRVGPLRNMSLGVRAGTRLFDVPRMDELFMFSIHVANARVVQIKNFAVAGGGGGGDDATKSVQGPAQSIQSCRSNPQSNPNCYASKTDGSTVTSP